MGEYFWEMEFCEFVNAWIGYIEQRREQAAIDFENARMISVNASFSSKQQKQTNKMKNPYTKRKPQGKPVTMGEVTGLLSALARVN